MSLGDYGRRTRPVIFFALVAALVACLLPASILAAPGPPENASAAAKKCKAKKGGKTKKRKCRKQNAKPPAPKVTLTVASDQPGAGTVTSAPTGISCGTVCTAKFAPGTPVHLSASDASGYFQVDWAGGGCSGRGACELVLNSDTTVVARFLERVTVTGSGENGTVEALAAASPYGICTGGTCTVNSGDDVTLTAVPDSGYSFGGWGGDCSGADPVLTLTSVAAPDKSCTASFVPFAPLTVGFYGDGFGTVTSSPAGINCPGTCTASFPAGTVVTLNPTPADGSALAGWFDACDGIGAIPCTLTVSGPTTATVYFAGPDPGGPPD